MFHLSFFSYSPLTTSYSTVLYPILSRSPLCTPLHNTLSHSAHDSALLLSPLLSSPLLSPLLVTVYVITTREFFVACCVRNRSFSSLSLSYSFLSLVFFFSLFLSLSLSLPLSDSLSLAGFVQFSAGERACGVSCCKREVLLGGRSGRLG